MANYSTSANIVLSVNGSQASKMMGTLKNDAQRLEKEISKAAAAGDKVSMKKFQRELNSTRKVMAQLQGSAFSVDNVLRRLDKASPKELNRTLTQLKRQLNGIERGTKAWDDHVAKIRAVKAELENVNNTMRTQESLFSRISGGIKGFAGSIFGAAATLTGAVAIAKECVSAYAEMDQEMANVRKFTGMTEEQVDSLNEEFKKMDTRTSREQLNQLAQEAGRLGKTSEEDVLGFVKAADKINVALDDLGDGATLTLSKLTGIFGDEERLGTEKALLSVGSVINELSQNCSASAPYIAEFTSRMGGVGAQAGMTVQQIMAYAAVLDTNNQALEASSTALSQVIVRIYQDPAKYAKAAGMDVQHFSELVKTDMNAALIELLSTLNQAGGMDVLSPMFKDMGENGSRAISALSTLANNIEDVKNQQIVANRAFEEATSIDNEYNVQNNTVQASLDKAKNRFHELAVELGEKLQPAMRLVISSSSKLIEVILAVVNFVAKYKREILVLCAAIATYTIAAKGAAMVQTAWNLVTATGSAVMSAAKTVMLALRIAYLSLTGQIQKAEAATRLFNSTTKASPWGIVLAVIALAIGALIDWTQRLKESREETERLRKESEEFKKSITNVDEAAAGYAANEVARLEAIYTAATDENKSREERQAAAESMQKLYPEIFKNFSTEEIMVGRAKKAYDQLRDSIINVARARAAADKIKENEGQLLTLEQQAPGLKAQMDKDKRQYDADEADLKERVGWAQGGYGVENFWGTIIHHEGNVSSSKSKYEKSKADYDDNQTKQRQLKEANKYLIEQYGISAATLADDKEPSFSPAKYNKSVGGVRGNSGNNNSPANRFAAEEDWRKQMEASARISYATGETDYLAYTKRMDEIAVEFYEKQLLHTDLSETERMQITAQWREAQRKQAENASAASIEEETNAYNKRMAELKQFYIDGSISKETYDQKTEELEIEHQNNIIAIHQKGIDEKIEAENQAYDEQKKNLDSALSEGRINQEDYDAQMESMEQAHQNRLRIIQDDGNKQMAAANNQLQNLLMGQVDRRQRETEEKERKFATMKKDYFGDNPKEKLDKYNEDLAALDEVYKREREAAGDNAAELLRIDEAYEKAKFALKKQYGQLSAEEEGNALKRGIAKSLEWLESDGGKAITGTLSTVTSGMSAIFSQLSSMMQADLEIQTAQINKRYDTEINRAEGNSYKIRKLEKDKEKEIAKAKTEANRKMFAIQVIQAVAQTAQNALNAYGSAAAIPVVGYILAPVAAAMAVAAGAMQVAAIKKQQQASQAQGYSEGGFTPRGRKDEAVGVVHAGEWVASQKLVNNPRTRPLLEALDYAQRTNTIGSITSADVSNRISANMAIASLAKEPRVIMAQSPAQTVVVEQNQEYAETMKMLVKRLNEPFFTVNTVSGDYGSLKAQSEYETLIRNKSPKK